MALGAVENAYKAILLANTELLEDMPDSAKTLDEELRPRMKDDDEDVTSEDDDWLLVEREEDDDELIVLLELLLLDDGDDMDDDDGLLCVLVLTRELLDELEFSVEEDNELLDDVS